MSSFVEKEESGPSSEIHECIDGLGNPDRCNGLPITAPRAKYDDVYFATDTFPYVTGYHGTAIVNR